MINTSNLDQARKEIQLLKKNKQQVIIQAQDNIFNRKIFENKDVDIVIGLESHDRKDYLKQRDSGLNEILCKLARKNNIKIGIDLDNLKKQDKKQKAILLSRTIQNIRLCKRTNTQIIILGKQNKQEITSLFLTLKASTQQAKQAFQ